MHVESTYGITFVVAHVTTAESAAGALLSGTPVGCGAMELEKDFPESRIEALESKLTSESLVDLADDRSDDTLVE